MLENAAESHPSSAHFVERTHGTQDSKPKKDTTAYISRFTLNSVFDKNPKILTHH